MTDKQNRSAEEEVTLARQKYAHFLNDADRYDTIQFTQADLEHLRHPNPQPLDSDYFISSPYSNSAKPKEEFEPKVKEEPATERAIFSIGKNPQPKPKATPSYEEFQQAEAETHTDDEIEQKGGISFKLPQLSALFRKRAPKPPLGEPIEEEWIEEADMEQAEVASSSKPMESFAEPQEVESSEIVDEVNESEPTVATEVKDTVVASQEELIAFIEDERDWIEEAEEDTNLYEEELEEPTIRSDQMKSNRVAEAKQSVGQFFNRLKTRLSQIGKKQKSKEEDILNLDEGAEWTEAEVAEYSETLSQETSHFSEPILTDQVLEELLTEDDLMVESELSDQQNLVRGTAWLTFGNVFSRILGALYVIPWATWLGAEYVQANGLYSAGYVPYSLFLAIATAGFPSAVAKQMAYYHSRKEYKVADKLFKYSVFVMLLTGLVSSAILFLFAPTLATHTPTENLDAAIAVIRSLVPALLILPLMSVLRGYFQGFNDMVPTAVSQVIEQIARVVYMLAATYAITQLYFGEVTQAVVHSTFAAFVGALASLIYLVVIYLRRLPLLERLMAQSAEHKEIDFKESIRIMLVDSIPFILLGSGIIIAQVMDTYTFRPMLYATTILRNREIVELYGVLSLDVNKLIMIIISLAVAVSTSAIPAIASKFAVRDVEGTRSITQRVIVLFCYIMFPAAVGMASLSTNVYQLFYAQGSVHGPSLLVTACYMSIVLGAYTVLSTVLQSMNYRRATIQYLALGLVVKLVVQFPLIALFQTHGAILSTMIGFAVATGLMYWKIDHRLHIGTKQFSVQLIKIVVATIIMGLATTLWGRMLDAAFGQVGRGMTFVKVSLVVLIGILIYFAIMALFGMLPILFGDRHKDLQDKLKVM
ncbi:oligosaccharide flippase family protein [Aerococcaceae bacterium NML191292]|nr:oligosaccharide flippase family protein [Aerococcaceae bacterium NML191292]